jgi:hypothetical protein
MLRFKDFYFQIWFGVLEFEIKILQIVMWMTTTKLIFEFSLNINIVFAFTCERSANWYVGLLTWSIIVKQVLGTK